MKTVILLTLLMPSMAYAFEWGDLLKVDTYAVYLPFLILVLEYVLGKTDWVQANSIVDLILRGLLKLVKKDEKV